MYKEVFIRDFSALGRILENSLKDTCNNPLLNKSFEDSVHSNRLFTTFMQREALSAICKKFLNNKELEKWLTPYSSLIKEQNKIVGLVLAGNIPLVGFNDFLVTLAAGFKVEVKLSHKDRFLLPQIFEILCEVNPFWKKRVSFVLSLHENIDLLMTSGGEQSGNFFNHKFSLIPRIVRGTRSSLAILDGSESFDSLEKLVKDIFLYYGLGCRSVSTLLIPNNFQIEKIVKASKWIESNIVSEDYLAAYKYQKAVAEMSKNWYLDGGFFIFSDLNEIPPPMGVVNIHRYSSFFQVENFIEANRANIQCVVNGKFNNKFIMFGEAQYPYLDDYPDGINSLEFLLNNI